MASIRYRNDRYNVRYRLNGKQHEKSFKTYEEANEFLLQLNKRIDLMQFKDFLLTRFPEGHSAYLPLQVHFNTGCALKEAYEMRFSEIDFEKGEWRSYKLSSQLMNLLKRHIKRTMDCNLMFRCNPIDDYVNVYPTTGKRVNPSQIYYILKVLEKEVKGA